VGRVPILEAAGGATGAGPSQVRIEEAEGKVVPRLIRPVAEAVGRFPTIAVGPTFIPTPAAVVTEVEEAVVEATVVGIKIGTR
jgi:hypothetical protein